MVLLSLLNSTLYLFPFFFNCRNTRSKNHFTMVNIKYLILLLDKINNINNKYLIYIYTSIYALI